MKDPYRVIRMPVITEKSTRLRGDENKYIFYVNNRANKIEIKQAIEELFKVKVLDVNTIKLKGKKKRLGIYQGRRSHRKKAIVKLRQGDTIGFFEGA